VAGKFEAFLAAARKALVRPRPQGGGAPDQGRVRRSASTSFEALWKQHLGFKPDKK
jgi:hypothetical protein